MKQVIVWVNPFILIPSEFVAYMEKNGFTVNYLEEFYTDSIDDVDSYRNVLFSIADNDWKKFSIWRLGHSIHFWESYLDSGIWERVPKEILKKYPYTWGNRPDKYQLIPGTSFLYVEKQ